MLNVITSYEGEKGFVLMIDIMSKSFSCTASGITVMNCSLRTYSKLMVLFRLIKQMLSETVNETGKGCFNKR